MNGKIIVPNVQFVVKNYLINTIMSNFINKIKKFQNKVDIYYIVIDSNFETNMYNIISEYCNENDTEYINNFINTNDKLSHLGSIVLQKFFVNLFKPLDNLKEIKIKKDQHNKPYIDNMKYNYNISHDKNIIVGVFSKKPIGIDIMQDNLETLNRINTIDHLFYDCEKNINYICLWTILEGYLKAVGKGFIDFENRNFKITKSGNNFNIINGKKNTIMNDKLFIEKKYYYISVIILE
jgi:phosphopantetheinyl transferase